jgi:hypothetical protein
VIWYGEPPFLECSTLGDRRFSAFCARVNGRSIEEQYQAAKRFEDGSTGLHWRQAKGRRPVNDAQTRQLYADLWDQYIWENPHLLDIIIAQTGLCDSYGRPGSVCQATELWRIRNEYYSLRRV